MKKKIIYLIIIKKKIPYTNKNNIAAERCLTNNSTYHSLDYYRTEYHHDIAAAASKLLASPGKAVSFFLD